MKSNWFLIPGLGATEFMFKDLREALEFSLICPAWPKYHGETGYRELAQRFIHECGIREGDVVGGASLGGMIALEIAKIVNVRAVVLLGSCTEAGMVRRPLVALSPLAGHLPVRLLQTIIGVVPHPLCRMFAECDPEFMRAMALHIKHWQGNEQVSAPLFQLHGKRDLMIRPPKKCDCILPKAGHVPTMTHTQDCADFLRSVHRQVQVQA